MKLNSRGVFSITYMHCLAVAAARVRESVLRRPRLQRGAGNDSRQAGPLSSEILHLDLAGQHDQQVHRRRLDTHAADRTGARWGRAVSAGPLVLIWVGC